jgi:5-bromo-4-chloroindolyl phosphate hydrolysis protein
VKRYAVEWMIQCHSLQYTRQTLRDLKRTIGEEIGRLGGHELLMKLIEKLDQQLDREEREFETQILTAASQPLVTTL